MPNLLHLSASLGFALCLALSPMDAMAAGGGDDAGGPFAQRSPEFTTAERAVKAGRYDAAIPLFQKVIEADPGDANAYNYLGFSHRKLGRYETALAFYHKALKLDPDHRGAREYLGELYLELGDVKKAEQQLAALDDLCNFGCEEFTDLEKAIKGYKGGRK